jgi:hypothetical protein
MFFRLNIDGTLEATHRYNYTYLLYSKLFFHSPYNMYYFMLKFDTFLYVLSTFN